MASRAQLLALHRRMIDAQRDLINHAAEADTLPTRSALSQIADLEQALLEIEALIKEPIIEKSAHQPAEMLAAAE